MTNHPTGEPPERNWFTDSLLSLEDLAQLREPTPLYRADDGRPLLFRGTLAQLSGGYGTYKSFIAIDAACSVASGLATGHPEGVVFVAAEGAAGILKRARAWCAIHNIDPAVVSANLFVRNGAVQLGNTVDMGAVKEHCVEFQPALLIVDIRAKCSTGVEENSTTEQGPLIRAVESIVDASAVTTLVIHHTNKVGTDRGTNAWPSGVWSHLLITKTKELVATIECDKHKDAPSGCKHHVRLVRHQLSESEVPRRVEETTSDYEERRFTLAVAENVKAQPAATPDAQIEKIVRHLDRLALPSNTGAPKAAEKLRLEGIKASNQLIADAVKVRKSRPLTLSADLSAHPYPQGATADSGHVGTGTYPSVSPPLGETDRSDSGAADSQIAPGESAESGINSRPDSSAPGRAGSLSVSPLGDTDGVPVRRNLWSPADQPTEPRLHQGDDSSDAASLMTQEAHEHAVRAAAVRICGYLAEEPLTRTELRNKLKGTRYPDGRGEQINAARLTTDALNYLVALNELIAPEQQRGGKYKLNTNSERSA